MDQAKICQLLQHSLHSDAAYRMQAEIELKQISAQVGFLPALISIVSSAQPQADDATRHAASIYFKNHVLRAWSSTQDADKAAVRASIVQSLVHCHANSRKQLTCSLASILASDDNVGAWPGLFDDIVQRISSPDRGVLFSGLLAMNEFVGALRWKGMADRREPVSKIIEATFPQLAGICKVILASPGIELQFDAAFMIKTIFKTFFAIIHTDLPKELHQPALIGEWLSVFVQVFDVPCVSSSQISATDVDELHQHPWWKARKWSLYIVNRIYARYGNTSIDTFREKGYKKFAAFFMDNCADKLLYFFMAQLQKIAAKEPYSKKVVHGVCEFVTNSVKAKRTWLILKPNIASIFEHFIFPSMCISEADEEEMREEPVEYIQKGNDPFSSFKSLDTAASEMLVELYMNRKKHVMPLVLGYVTPILTNPPNYRAKEGALSVLFALSGDLLASDSPVRDQLSSLLASYVVPDVHSDNIALQTKALRVIRTFCDLDSKESVIQLESLTAGQMTGWPAVFNAVLPLITSNNPLVVRVYAALALETMFERENVREIARSQVASMMKEYLDLTRMIDLDLLTSAMERLVEMFPDEVAPFSVQLSQELIRYCFRILEDSKNASEEEETYDKVFTMMGFINTISTIIMSVPTPGRNNENAANVTETHVQTLLALEETIIPFVQYTLVNKCEDLYEEVFGILEAIMFQRRQVSQSVWSLFPVVCQLISDNGVDYIEEAFPTFDNFISFGADVVGSNNEVKGMLLEVLTSLLFCKDELDAEYQILGFKIAESLFLNCKPAQIDDMMPTIFRVCAPHILSALHNMVFHLQCLEVFLAAIYYNPEQAMTLMHEAQCLEHVLSEFLKHTEKLGRVHDRKLSIVTILKIFSTSTLLQNAQIQQSTPNFLKALVHHFKELPRAEELRTELENMGDGLDSEDSDDSDDQDETDMTRNSHEVEDSGDELEDGVEDFDEDLVDDEQEYLDKLNRYKDHDTDADSWFDKLHEEVDVESKMDDIDVYAAFYQTMEGMRASANELYVSLVNTLTKEEQEQAQMVMKLGFEKLTQPAK